MDPTKLTTKLRFNLQYMTDENLEGRYIAKSITVPSRYGWLILVSFAFTILESYAKRKGAGNGNQ